MRVETIEQYRIMQFIKDNFVIEKFKIELIDKNIIRITDSSSESITFVIENNEVKQI